jgi:predicted AlkP superfamily pyrophosphatase or phosphodiesterase
MNRQRFFFSPAVILLVSIAVWAAVAPQASSAPSVAANFSSPQGAPGKPRLILLLVMDQFRQDFLDRHRAAFVPGGFRLLIERGAVFANCNYQYATTLTAPGHAVISTGSYPMSNGIIGNDWYDPASGSMTTSDRDSGVKLLGAANDSPGSSPHWLVGSAFGDELRLASNGRSRVLAISVKARAAVLPGGKGANAAYWLDPDTLHAISSTYYMKDLPEWVKQFNARDRVAEYAGKPWKPVDNAKGEAFKTFPQAANAAGRSAVGHQVTDSAFVTDIEFALARAAIEHEKLGAGPATDFLSVSVSATDLVGHIYGPDAPETRDAILRADRAIAALLRFVDVRVGLANVWVVLTADHGVAPRAEVANRFGQQAGRVPDQQVIDKVEQALNAAYPPAAVQEKWVTGYSSPWVFLNHRMIRARELNEAEVARKAAQALLELGGFSAAFTPADLAGCRPAADLLGEVCRGYYAPRAGDVYLVFQPYWIYGMKNAPQGAGHGTPYSYDTHVPLILMGNAFRPGTYYTAASPADIAVTLAVALGINAPALAAGRVLDEALPK